MLESMSREWSGVMGRFCGRYIVRQAIRRGFDAGSSMTVRGRQSLVVSHPFADGDLALRFTVRDQTHESPFFTFWVASGMAPGFCYEITDTKWLTEIVSCARFCASRTGLKSTSGCPWPG